MAQGNLKGITLAHWEIALRTGVITGAVMFLSFIEPRKWLHNRFTTGVLTGAATATSDFVAHPAAISGEAILTGVVAAILCVVYSFVMKVSEKS
jgi:hypothetical protein